MTTSSFVAPMTGLADFTRSPSKMHQVLRAKLEADTLITPTAVLVDARLPPIRPGAYC